MSTANSKVFFYTLSSSFVLSHFDFCIHNLNFESTSRVTSVTLDAKEKEKQNS